jgi:hypothetical protein
LKAFDADKISFQVESKNLAEKQGKGARHLIEAEIKSDGQVGREFLDSCFVLMPFGEWYDTYYREIFSPACKEAGFEPIRADGVFTTGSVIEQIWEQINNAQVLIADLTGKNPNVFYELGLSHGISKPVVLLAAQLEDVPFDLRHLRTIIYDIRDPFWGDKLKKSVVAHLRSAKQDPGKSIPQPFRMEKNGEDKSGM